jgi:hypothetical protein
MEGVALEHCMTFFFPHVKKERKGKERKGR